MNITEKINEAERKLEILSDVGSVNGFLVDDELNILKEVQKTLQEAKEEIQKAYNMEK